MSRKELLEVATRALQVRPGFLNVRQVDDDYAHVELMDASGLKSVLRRVRIRTANPGNANGYWLICNRWSKPRNSSHSAKAVTDSEDAFAWVIIRRRDTDDTFDIWYGLRAHSEERPTDRLCVRTDDRDVPQKFSWHETVK